VCREDHNVIVCITVTQMKFMLTEVKVLTNLIQTETCLREANDDDYADIDK